jgi:hypothetical protein
MHTYTHTHTIAVSVYTPRARQPLTDTTWQQMPDMSGRKRKDGAGAPGHEDATHEGVPQRKKGRTGSHPDLFDYNGEDLRSWVSSDAEVVCQMRARERLKSIPNTPADHPDLYNSSTTICLLCDFLCACMHACTKPTCSACLGHSNGVLRGYLQFMKAS